MNCQKKNKKPKSIGIKEKEEIGFWKTSKHKAKDLKEFQK